MSESLTYKQRAERCSCLPKARLHFIAQKMKFADDFSDGAFFAYLEENGIDASELEPFSEGHKCK